MVGEAKAYIKSFSYTSRKIYFPKNYFMSSQIKKGYHIPIALNRVKEIIGVVGDIGVGKSALTIQVL